MPNYKLTYFDFDGGRGELIRIAFHAAGIAFEDIRISFAEFADVRQKARFKCLPVLELDGAQVTQSNAIGRYIGKMAGLYPENDLQALYCDEVLESIEDLNHYIGQTFGKEGEELKRARQELVEGRLTTFIKGLDALLARGGGEYFADNRLTVADLKAFVQSRSLSSGVLDHIPVDLLQQLSPGLAAHKQRIASDPIVHAYYESRKTN